MVGFRLPHTQELYDWEHEDYGEGEPYLAKFLL